MTGPLVNISTPPNMEFFWREIMSGAEYGVAVSFDEPPIIIDVGGCIGVFARWARLVWPDCQLHIYEPNPKAHRLLEKNCKHLIDGYEIHKTAVLGHHSVTGDPRTAMVRLFQGHNNLGEASVYLETGANPDEFVDVPVTFASDLPECNILKADCEGPEREILIEYLASHDPPDVVMIEYHSAGESKRTQEMMSLSGYRLVSAHEANGPTGIVDPNRGVLIWRHEPHLKNEQDK